MSISKITEAISPVDKTKKINDIIDAVNGITVNNSTVTFKQGDVVKGTMTTNQASNSVIELDAGGSSDNIFIATYNSTPHADLVTAYNSGKTIIVQEDLGSSTNENKFYASLVNRTKSISPSIDSFVFAAASGDALYFYECKITSGVSYTWTYEYYVPEKASNKVTSLSSSSTNTQYPSAKCVYDELQNHQSVTSLAALTDTNIQSPSNYNVLNYRNGAWVNSSTSEVATITSYTNSHSGGVIVYSNNYCIQFGKVTRSAATETITLARAYKDVDYAKFIQAFHTAASTDGRPPLVHEPTTSGTTTDSFIVNIYTGYTGYYWRTEGFLA